MSALERLPTELLERVFHFCLNLGLPRASPIVGAKLSSTTVFNGTMFAAFGPTWDSWYGREKVVEEVEGNDEISDDGDAELQSAVLRCRWADLPTLLQAKEHWIESYATDRTFQPHCRLSAAQNAVEYKTPWSFTNTRPDFLKELNPPEEQEGEDEENATLLPPPSLTQTEYLDADYSAFEAFTSELDGDWPWTAISWAAHPHISPSTEIPHSLLLGPFTPTSLKQLFYLIKSGATVSWHSSTSGESALEGLRSAIIAGNTQAIHLLLWSGLRPKMDAEIFCWAIRNAGGDGLEGRLRTVSQLLRAGWADDTIGRRFWGKVEKELMDLRDQGIWDGDSEEGVEKVEYVKRIMGLELLRGRVGCET